MKDPKCPRCQRKSSTPSGTTPRAYYCHGCRIEFEPESDGDIGYGDPARIAERREQREIADQARRKREYRAKLKGGL